MFGSIKGYVALGSVVAVGLVVWAGYTYVTNLQEAAEHWRVEATKETIAREAADAKILLMERMNLAQERERIILTQKYEQAEDKANKWHKLYADHNLGNLMQKKPGLITNRMRKATNKVIRELEEATK